MSTKVICTVDIGGTKTEGYLFEISENSYKVIDHHKCYTQAEDGKATVLKVIESTINQLFKGTKKIDAIGVSLPGIVRDNNIVYLPNVQCLNGVNLQQMLKRKYKVPVQLRNDGDCFTLAEAIHGAGKGYKSVATVTVGTGVGGGLVINKQIIHNAMEIGHTVIVKDGWAAPSGLFGTLEAYINGNSISKRYFQVKRVLKRPKEIFEEKNQVATHVMEETANYFAVGLGNVINTAAPDVIVLGGGICKSRPFIKRTMTHLKNNPFYKMRAGSIKIKDTKLEGLGAPLGVAIETAQVI